MDSASQERDWRRVEALAINGTLWLRGRDTEDRGAKWFDGKLSRRAANKFHVAYDDGTTSDYDDSADTATSMKNAFMCHFFELTPRPETDDAGTTEQPAKDVQSEKDAGQNEQDETKMDEQSQPDRTAPARTSAARIATPPAFVHTHVHAWARVSCQRLCLHHRCQTTVPSTNTSQQLRDGKHTPGVASHVACHPV